MRKRHSTKLVLEGQYIAEVDVQLVETEEEWSPYLSLKDACKLDAVRDALGQGDVKAASSMVKYML